MFDGTAIHYFDYYADYLADFQIEDNESGNFSLANYSDFKMNLYMNGELLNKQQSSLPNVDSANQASACLADLEAGLWTELPWQALSGPLDREIRELAVTFWQELADEAAARGLECASLQEMAASWIEQDHDCTIPVSVAIGVFCITVDFASDSVSISIGGVPVTKPCTLAPSSVIENLCKAEAELKEKQTVPRLALMRLVTAASVLSSERVNFTLVAVSTRVRKAKEQNPVY